MSDDVSKLTKSLGDVIIDASEHEDLVNPSVVLESFTEALLKSRDPLVREAFLESCLDVLKPRGDELDNGRLSVLRDAALTCIPAFLPLMATEGTSAQAKAVLDLLAERSEPREVVMTLNAQLGKFAEQADPYAVSDSEDEDSDVEDQEIDWVAAFPQITQVLDMYATALPRLKTQRSTPTLLALQDALLPLLRAVPNTAPPEMAMGMSRSLLSRVAGLAGAAWMWSQTTQDAGGEQRAMLTELIQVAVTIFGPCVGADLTSRWFVATFPKFAGLHPQTDGGWEEGQAALDASLATCKALGIDQDDLVERITNTSSVKPHSSIASLILLAASLPALHGSSDDFAPSKSIIEDAMPVLTAGIGGSAIDAATALTWALVHAAENGKVDLDYDQSTFFLELVMPLIQLDSSPTTRTAMTKLLGATIVATPGVLDQIRLYKQLLEPINPFEGIRVLAINLLRQQIASPPQPSPLLTPKLLEHLALILFTVPTDVLEAALPNLMASMYPVWLTECANLVWFLLERDAANASGIADPKRLASIRDGFLVKVGVKAKVWIAGAKEMDPQVQLVLDRLDDAVARATAAVKAKAEVAVKADVEDKAEVEAKAAVKA